MASTAPPLTGFVGNGEPRGVETRLLASSCRSVRVCHLLRGITEINYGEV